MSGLKISNYTLAKTTVLEDSITLSETFMLTSCKFLPKDAEDVIPNQWRSQGWEWLGTSPTNHV